MMCQRVQNPRKKKPSHQPYHNADDATAHLFGSNPMLMAGSNVSSYVSQAPGQNDHIVEQLMAERALIRERAIAALGTTQNTTSLHSMQHSLQSQIEANALKRRMLDPSFFTLGTTTNRPADVVGGLLGGSSDPILDSLLRRQEALRALRAPSDLAVGYYPISGSGTATATTAVNPTYNRKSDAAASNTASLGKSIEHNERAARGA